MVGSCTSESTATLLSRVRGGDAEARERLCAEYLPILLRWAHGRLPSVARDLTETTDLVQVTLVRALDAVDRLESRHEGAFLAYLRTILLNAMRNEIKRSLRSGPRVTVDEVAAAMGRSSADAARMLVQRALAALSDRLGPGSEPK